MSNQSKTFIVKQLKYIDIPLEHSWKVPILQELLNTRMVWTIIYVKGFATIVIRHNVNTPLYLLWAWYLALDFKGFLFDNKMLRGSYLKKGFYLIIKGFYLIKRGFLFDNKVFFYNMGFLFDKKGILLIIRWFYLIIKGFIWQLRFYLIIRWFYLIITGFIW